MPQNEQFDVLGELAATAPDQQPQQRREREVSEGKEHPPMLPESRPRSLESRNRGFETPQGTLLNRVRAAPTEAAAQARNLVAVAQVAGLRAGCS